MIRKSSRVAGVFLMVTGLMSALNICLAAPAEENFKWYCVQCHGPEGAGDGINAEVEELPTGPMALSKSKEMKKFSNDEIIKTLTKGGPANTLESLMPPWGNTFTADEIEELMLYVRSLCKDADCPT